MKKIMLLVMATLLSFGAYADGNDDEVLSGVLVVEGTYQNRNLYVMNNVHSSGVGFCTYEVRVNGEITTDEWNSSAFEIDLSHLQLSQGDAVFVEIKYKDNCPPKVLNPGVVTPKPTFNTESIKLSPEGDLEWTTTNEHGELPFHIQVFKWNKWITVGEVMGNGSEKKNVYKYKVDLVSGENKVRVVQKGLDRNIVVSPTAKTRTTAQPVTFEYDKRADEVKFSRETHYEVWNEFGQITKRGYGSTADLKNLKNGTYWISYDNTTSDFKKR